MTDYQIAVRQIMRDLDMDQSALAAELGVAQGTVSRWLSGSQPKFTQMKKIDALLLRRSGAPVITEPPTSIIRIRGKIGAGAVIMPEHEQIPPEGLFEIEIPFPVPAGARAFVVEGESMFPRYDPDDVIVCWKEIIDAEELRGVDAVVQTVEGKRYLKRVHRGRTKKLFDLESQNAPLMRDVQLAWAARVSIVVKKDEWRSVTRRGSI